MILYRKVFQDIEVIWREKGDHEFWKDGTRLLPLKEVSFQDGKYYLNKQPHPDVSPEVYKMILDWEETLPKK